MATLTINSSTLITDNQATQYGGGGYLQAGGTVTDNNSTYNANTAIDGGAVYLEGATPGPANPPNSYTATGVTYENNAAAADGGAIFDATAPPYSNPPAAPTNYPNLTLAPSNTFTGNTAATTYLAAVSLAGTPNISEPTSISTGQTVLNNADVNYYSPNLSGGGDPLAPPVKDNDSGGSVAPGGTFNYVITVSNTGNGPTENPWFFTDQLPAGVSLNGTPTVTVNNAQLTVTPNADSTNTSLDYSIAPALNPGEVAIITIPVIVDGTDFSQGESLDPNTAVVNPGEETDDIPVTELTPPVIVFPELTVDKANNALLAVAPGETFNYVITITNTGSAPTANPYTLTDTLPAGFSLNGVPTVTPGSLTNSGTGNTLDLQLSPELAPGDTVTLLIPVIVDNNAAVGPTTPNVAIVDPGNGGQPSEGTDPLPPVINIPSLNVEKSNNATYLIPGETFDYVLTVTNVSDVATAQPFTVTDNLPPYTSLSKPPVSTAGPVTNNGTATQLNLSIDGSIPPGGTIYITIPVMVATDAPTGQLGENIATVDPGNGGQPSEGIDTNPPTVEVPAIEVTKTSSIEQAQPGQTFNYTINITNTSNVPTANPVTITDNLPNYISLNGAPTSTSGTVVNSGNNEQLNLSIDTSIPPGGTLTVTLPVVISESAPNGALGENIATVDPGNGGNPESGIDLSPPIILFPIIHVTKLASTDTTYPGDTFDYVLTITNVGNYPTSNPLIITDTLPAGVTFVGPAVAIPGNVVNTGNNTNLVLSYLPALAVGSTVSIVLPVKVNADAPEGVLDQNTVTVNPGNNGEPETGIELNPPVVMVPTLDITKVASEQTVEIGQVFYYEVTITNTSNVPTGDPFNVVDTLPDYVTLAGNVSAAGYTVVNKGNTKNLNLDIYGALNPGASIVLQVPVVVSSEAPNGSLNPNTVLVNPGNGGDPEIGIEVTPPIVTYPIFEGDKTACPKSASPCGIITYTIIINNTGNVPTSEFLMVDTLPLVKVTGGGEVPVCLVEKSAWGMLNGKKVGVVVSDDNYTPQFTLVDLATGMPAVVNVDDEVYISFKVRIPVDAVIGQLICNSVTFMNKNEITGECVRIVSKCCPINHCC